RSVPITDQQPGLNTWLGTFDSWPDVSSSCTPLTDMSIQAMSGWGANIVRVPMSSTFWGSDPSQAEPGCQAPFPAYRSNIDAVVASITARGMVALLDLHSVKRIPCSPDWNRQHPMPDSSAIGFWQSVSRRYVTNPLVAFELYNEPHTNYLNYGQGSWALWLYGGSATSCPKQPSNPIQDACPGGDGARWTAAGMQDMYNAIRTVESSNSSPSHLVFVAGNEFTRKPPPPGYMLKDADGSLANNLIYTVHHYSVTTTQAGGRSYTIPSCAPSSAAPSGCFKTWVDFSTTHSVAVNVNEFGWLSGPDADPYSPTYPKPSGQQQHENVICSATNADFGWMAYRWSSDNDHLPTLNHYYGLLASQDQYLPTLVANSSGKPAKDALSIDPTAAGGKKALANLLNCYTPSG
ncbi:MAG: cellulase family glycosylhydrolase, partial [Actinomycetota bacterium]